MARTDKSHAVDEEDRDAFSSESEGEGALRRKSLLTKSKGAMTKVHPDVTSNDGPKLEKKPSKYTKEQTQATMTPRERHVAVRGVLAVVMLTCLCWTIGQIFLNIAPNNTINFLMSTDTFDYGSFWLMVTPSKEVVALATFGLVMICVGYVTVIFKMVKCRSKQKQAYLVRQTPILDKVNILKKVEKVLDDAATTRGIMSPGIARLAAAFSRGDSIERKRVKLLMKFGDLALETFLLHRMLESGSPAILIAVFTTIVGLNSLICAGMMFVPFERAPMAEDFIDILFDFLVAIGCPILTVVYCFSTFTFDREKFAINLEVFPAGWFEQGANVVADPVQTAVIYKSLNSLRIMSTLDFFSRMGVNATLCFRLGYYIDRIHNPRKQRTSVYPKRSFPGAIVLVVSAMLLVVFVEESIRTSSLACEPHPECVVNARRWTIVKSGSLTQCPCLTMIDRDVAPKTYAEWEAPRNVTDKVAQLATTGDLQTLTLTNRYLVELPEELRSCKDLRHLSLEYTHLQTLPSWFKEHSKLEYLHVESKFTSPVLALSDDLFDHMSSLTFLHLAAFMTMTKLPSFQGLTNLKSITLACFLAMEELPAFDSLQHLERLVLASMSAMESLPDLAPITDLKSFAASDRGAWCCNGFIGNCNLADRKCGVAHPVWGNPAVSCLASNRTEKVATAATLKMVEKFSSTLCGPALEIGVLEGPPTEELMAPCNGTLYRECKRPDNIESMCYNARFMGIACTTNPFPIEMRRRQIARGVGEPCDALIEAWLGCK